MSQTGAQTKPAAKPPPLASVVINNFNYGRFLRDAIDSALGQTYGNTEVIVVDDGSTDNSRDVIRAYGNRVIPVLKENAGQTSALNAGFLKSRGEIVLFLDADDVLLPTALEQAVARFQTGDVAQVHWPLWEIDATNQKSGKIRPRNPLPEGRLRDRVLEAGPDCWLHPPTSGNAWSRKFLDQVFPLAELERTLHCGCAGADACLSSLAPLAGEVRTILEPQGCFRVHDRNHYVGVDLPTKVQWDFVQYNHRCEVLRDFCRKLGFQPDIEKWKKNNAYHVWIQRLQSALEAVKRVIPVGTPFILVDEDQWRPFFDAAGHATVPFTEKFGLYWGPPTDDEASITGLERLRQRGTAYVVFAWPAFWWLDHYRGLHQFLQSRFPCVLRDEAVIVFDMQQSVGEPAAPGPSNPELDIGEPPLEEAIRPAGPRNALRLKKSDLLKAIAKIRPYTMVSDDSLLELARQVGTVLTKCVPGNFVECGVWRGGAPFLMAELLQQAGVRDRKVWLCDPFESVPAPQAVDLPAVQAYAADPADPHARDNYTASFEEVQQAAAELGLSAYTEFVKGGFHQTLPLQRANFGTIALLRIDADRQRDVSCCLENLYDQVVSGGFIIFDDYFTHDGCAVAVHEFLGKRHLPFRLESAVGEWEGEAALFRKGNQTWFDTRSQVLWDEKMASLPEDLASCLPAGEHFIFVDDTQLAGALPGEVRAIPFLEKDGQYWGPPATDDAAIRDLERLRRAGAHFIVFAWPSFWWLEFYKGFAASLRSKYPCIANNDSFVVYDLRRQAK